MLQTDICHKGSFIIREIDANPLVISRRRPKHIERIHEGYLLTNIIRFFAQRSQALLQLLPGQAPILLSDLSTSEPHFSSQRRTASSKTEGTKSLWDTSKLVKGALKYHQHVPTTRLVLFLWSYECRIQEELVSVGSPERHRLSTNGRCSTSNRCPVRVVSRQERRTGDAVLERYKNGNGRITDPRGCR